jgi:hypothetical protein
LLDDTALKDRFQQFMQIARELLGDFREVEHNFRLLDRKVRERIALWEGSKGNCSARSWASAMPSRNPTRAAVSEPFGIF